MVVTTADPDRGLGATRELEDGGGCHGVDGDILQSVHHAERQTSRLEGLDTPLRVAALVALVCVRPRGAALELPAHLDQVALIKQRLSIPVISNGNVRNAAELVEALQLTAADGVMSAEGALDDPAIFAKAIEHVEVERARLTEVVKEARALKADKRDHGRKLTAEEKAKVKERKAAKRFLAQLPELRRPPPLSSAVPMPAPMPPAAASSSDGDKEGASRAAEARAGAPPTPRATQFDLAEQYIALAEAFPPPGGTDAQLSHAIFHLRRLCRTPLAEYDLLADLKACTTLAQCAGVIRRCRGYVEGALACKGRRRPPSYWRRQQRRNKL